MSANTTLLEERVFGEVKRLCYVGLDETTLLREVTERLRRVVPFEAYCAFVTDPMSRLIMRSFGFGHPTFYGSDDLTPQV